MDNAYIQVLADGTGIVAGPRILARLTKEQINMIREAN